MKRTTLLLLLVLLLGACVSPSNEAVRPPLRLVMLDPDGVVMAGYSNVPYLSGVGAEIGQDMNYWAINDAVSPTLFIASRGAVDEEGCIAINTAFVSADRPPAARVCGLAATDTASGCATYRFSDAIYGRGFVAVSDVALQWRLAFDQQARVSDCIVDAVVASVGSESLTPQAWLILTDYVGSQRSADP